MGVFDWLKSETPEQRYQAVMEEVFLPLRDQFHNLPERALIPVFSAIAEAAEKSFRMLLFQRPPPGVNLQKDITALDARSWLKMTMAAMLAYASEFDDSYGPLLGLSSQQFWTDAVAAYDRAFKDALPLEEIRHYAAGLAEDNRKQYSRRGETAPVMILTLNDNLRIGHDLLRSVWHREVKGELQLTNPDEILKRPDLREALLIGGSVWQAYSQIVHPVLERMFHQSR